MFAFNVFPSSISYAFCPNSSTKWQEVSDPFPLKYPRSGAAMALVPMSLFDLPSTCTPTNYQCT